MATQWNLLTEVLADSPYLYWRLHETSGTAIDDASPNNRDGTLFGTGSEYTMGIPGAIGVPTGRGIDFNTGATKDAGIIFNPAPSFPTTELTIEFFVRAWSLTSGRTIVSYAEGAQPDTVRVSSNGSNVTVTINGSSATFAWAQPFSSSGPGSSDAMWWHVAITWRSSDGRAQIFVNGTLAAPSITVGTGFSIPAGGSLVLMQDQDSVGGGYVAADAGDAKLTEFALYPAVLADARIEAHASAGMVAQYATAEEIPYEPEDLIIISPTAAAARYVNRVWSTAANGGSGGFVVWITDDPDSAGASFPGPGTWGVNTSGYVVLGETR
jgi:hypothetical protein